MDQGTYLVKLARKAVTNHLKNKETKDSKYPEKQGVFVTIQTYPQKELRGCIGFPEPLFSLSEATIQAAIAAAFEDPRFPKLKESELDKIIFVVSVLTIPKQIKSKPEELKNHIEIGKDGLIAEMNHFKGLLLPQVFTEETPQQAIEMTCQKANLLPEHYKAENFKLYKFQAKIFYETEPNKKVKFK